MLLARQAARSRAIDRMQRLMAGIGFLRRGHTAGESRMAETWATVPERELLVQLARLPVADVPSLPGRIELIGLLLIGTGEKTGSQQTEARGPG